MKKQMTLLLIAMVAMFAAPKVQAADQLEERVQQLLSQMTTAEKIAIIHAQSKFSSPGVARLGVPDVWCTDGPHGIRAEVKWDEWDQAGWTNDSCTAFPALTCLAATWNPECALAYGKAIGEEALYRNKTVLLGPGVNIYRTPLNGRNFEYMGEDPLLASRMVVPYIQGVQSNGVAACVKHYALNNQECNRHVANVHLSDRALYEIYLPAFRAAVQEGQAWSIMGSYNQLDGEYACHNHRLLVDILRGEWGFDGAVISDWGGCCNTDQAIHNGLDLEFGSWTDGLTMGATNGYDAYYLATPYLNQIRAGKVGTKELDEKAANVLRMILRTTMSGKRGIGSMVSAEHVATARRVADEGIVLLKNDPATKKGAKVLPLTGVKSILVVGENAVKMMTVGGGSSSLKAKYELSPLAGIQERAAKDGIAVKYVRGYVGDVGGEYNGVTTGQDLRDDRSAAELTAEAVAAAKEADVVIYIGGLNKAGHQDSEGADREQYGLPYGQDELISALAVANPRLATVFLSGNAFSMPWLKSVPAIVQAWFSGSETGHGIADILFGDVCPSGKMPYSIMPRLEDYPAHQFGEAGYPGINNEVTYLDDIYVGYRAWTTKKVKPLFGFGHGLSYTTFAYGKAVLEGNTLSVDITNTGNVAGAEVVQLYVAPVKSAIARPAEELRAFDKVFLAPGETKTVKFEVKDDMFTIFDEAKHDFVVVPGKYNLCVAASAADIKAKVAVVK